MLYRDRQLLRCPSSELTPLPLAAAWHWLRHVPPEAVFLQLQALSSCGLPCGPSVLDTGSLTGSQMSLCQQSGKRQDSTSCLYSWKDREINGVCPQEEGKEDTEEGAMCVGVGGRSGEGGGQPHPHQLYWVLTTGC